MSSFPIFASPGGPTHSTDDLEGVRLWIAERLAWERFLSQAAARAGAGDPPVRDVGAVRDSRGAGDSGDDLGVMGPELTVAFSDLAVGVTARTAAGGEKALCRMLVAPHPAANRMSGRRGRRLVRRLGDGLALAAMWPRAAVLNCHARRGMAQPGRRAADHHGDAVGLPDGDVDSKVVSVAARLCATAGEGEIVVTDDERVTAGAPRRRFDGPGEHCAVGAGGPEYARLTGRTAGGSTASGSAW